MHVFHHEGAACRFLRENGLAKLIPELKKNHAIKIESIGMVFIDEQKLLG